MLALSDLVSAQTADQIQANFINLMVSLGITSAPNWPKAAVSRSVLRVFSLLGAGFSQTISLIASSGFGDLAKNGWATLWARSVYNVERPSATFAAGNLTLVNTGGGTFSYGPGEVTALNSSTGKTYVNTATITLGSMSTVTVAFQATDQGAASSSATGAIDTLQTTLLNVTVSNAQPFVGIDQLDDISLRSLCIAKLGSLSPNGAKDIYRYVALADPTTIPILVQMGLTTQTTQPITRVNPLADGQGGVTVYLATAGGVPSSPDVAIINARIQAIATPLGTSATVVAATPVTVPVTYTAWLQGSGQSASTAETAFANQLVGYFAGLPIGGVVIPPDANGVVAANALEGQLFASLLGVVKAQISGSDTTILGSQVAVLGTITPTINFI